MPESAYCLQVHCTKGQCTKGKLPTIGTISTGACGRRCNGAKQMPTVIHLVDDDASFRKAMSRLLHALGFEVAAYGSARELLEHLPQQTEPSCILLDVDIPGLTGPELQDRLIALGYELPVIFLTGHGDIPMSVQAIKAGAEDFLTKPVQSEILYKAIVRALARHRQLLDHKAKLKSLQDLVCALTPREREVFELVVQGRMNKQIAFQLGATERTIKAHRHKIMEKVRAGSLAELVVIAERLGILSKGNSATEASMNEGVRTSLKDN
jgi:FixJ family two-component response regulator